MDKSRSLIFLVLAFSAIPASAQEANAPAHSADAPATVSSGQRAGDGTGPQFSDRYPRYEIAAGDTMDILFTFTPEYNQTLTVQPDGFVTLRDVGDVHVQGNTVPELTKLLQQKYSSILNAPQISIVLKDFEKPHFIVTGQVGRPGKYELRSDTTLMEAVGIAGGLLTSSKHSQVILFRRVPNQDGWMEAKNINLKEVYEGKFKEDLHLKPGDLVFVPKNKLSKIHAFLPTGIVNRMVLGPIPVP
jgi:polysaccharide export outer membrane protein